MNETSPLWHALLLFGWMGAADWSTFNCQLYVPNHKISLSFFYP